MSIKRNSKFLTYKNLNINLHNAVEDYCNHELKLHDIAKYYNISARTIKRHAQNKNSPFYKGGVTPFHKRYCINEFLTIYEKNHNAIIKKHQTQIEELKNQIKKLETKLYMQQIYCNKSNKSNKSNKTNKKVQTSFY